MARKRYQFKSTGKLVSARELNEPQTINRPVGIKTPLEFSTGKPNEEFYKMHFNPAEQIRDNFKNLLLTNTGERLGRADIGADLKSLLYDMAFLDSVEGEAIRRIEVAAQRSLPMVAIKDINVNFSGVTSQGTIDASADQNPPGESQGLSGLVARVLYTIPKISSNDQMIEVLITTGG